MKEVFIKYNPYTLKTDFQINGNPLSENSRIRELIGEELHMQEWIDKLPEHLIQEFNDNEYKITFHGTKLDYDDLIEVLTLAHKQGLINATVEHISAKEIKDKEGKIEEIFQKLQGSDCPFPELQTPAIKSAFEKAKTDEFEISVVATMSSGKSTLINALLGRELMPSKQEACTAIITQIKDDDNLPFRGEVYDVNGNILYKSNDITLDDMKNFNGNKDVSEIKIVGDIPFLTSEDTSLVLIDTPGPDNANDLTHEERQQNWLSKNSKALILYVMEPTFVSKGNDTLLKGIARSISLKGKKSRDRFLFVVNKLDGRDKKNDGSLAETMQRARDFLENNGIYNPNLFPAAALPALNIRLLLNGCFDEEIDEQEIDDTENVIKKLNRSVHLEQEAILPRSLQTEIDTELKVAEDKWQGQGTAKTNPHTALIHTGIPSIEVAIRQYIEKYANAIKVKNIVDTFEKELEDLRAFEKLKDDMLSNEEKRQSALKDIAFIENKIDDINEAKTFENVINNSLQTAKENSRKAIQKKLSEFQMAILKQSDRIAGRRLSKQEAEYEAWRLQMDARNIEEQFADDLREVIENNLEKTGNALLDDYRKKVAALTKKMPVDNFHIKPEKLINANIALQVNQFVETEEVAVGERTVKNTRRKWWNPFSWGEPKTITKTIYETNEYVSGAAFAKEFLKDFDKQFQHNAKDVLDKAIRESDNTASRLKVGFNDLDNLLKEKLNDLKTCASDREQAEDNIKQCKARLLWLENIKSELESILDI